MTMDLESHRETQLQRQLDLTLSQVQEQQQHLQQIERCACGKLRK
jgi:hypothetical protein